MADSVTSALSFMANGNITQTSFVMQDPSNDFYVLQATANAKLLGVTQAGSLYPPSSSDSGTQYIAVAGVPVGVFTTSGVRTYLTLGTGGCTRGDKLGSDANGNGITVTTSGYYYGAEAIESGNAGESVEVLLTFGTIH